MDLSRPAYRKSRKEQKRAVTGRAARNTPGRDQGIREIPKRFTRRNRGPTQRVRWVVYRRRGSPPDPYQRI